MRLTEAQARALVKVKAEGTVYAYNGVSIATARKLESLGLVEFSHRKVVTWWNRRSGRNHSMADWAIKLKGK